MAWRNRSAPPRSATQPASFVADRGAESIKRTPEKCIRVFEMPGERTSTPYYIVGLPEEPLEASEAKAKFERLSAELCKVFPHIEEIRAVVKPKKPAADHARYEVSVEIFTPGGNHSFTETGYNLASVFETMGPKMKRLLSSRQSRVTSTGGATLRKGAI